MNIPICTLSAGTTVVGIRRRALAFDLVTDHPADGRKIISVDADSRQPHGVRVSITETAPDAAVEISVGTTQ